MPSERWNQVQEILSSALDQSPDQRAAFVQRACRQDQELLEEVMALLKSEPPPNFLEPP